MNSLSTVCQPRVERDVDRGSIEVSIATIDRHLIAGVISIHDPPLCRHFIVVRGLLVHIESSFLNKDDFQSVLRTLESSVLPHVRYHEM